MDELGYEEKFQNLDPRDDIFYHSKHELEDRGFEFDNQEKELEDYKDVSLENFT